MILVDTNVLVDVLQDDPQWADWSTLQLRAQSKIRQLVINPIIYSELSLMYESLEVMDQTIASIGLSFSEIPKPALFLAGKAFIRYRRESDAKKNVLADFLIGAHAAAVNWPVLTRDPRRYRTYFPSVDLITP